MFVKFGERLVHIGVRRNSGCIGVLVTLKGTYRRNQRVKFSGYRNSRKGAEPDGRPKEAHQNQRTLDTKVNIVRGYAVSTVKTEFMNIY